jgi:PP-loop superfamily ATP-utilizing enzyme
MLNAADLIRFQTVLEGPLRAKYTELYVSHMTQYDNFLKKTGRQCPFCKAAAKHIFLSEYERKGQEFLDRFTKNDWSGYV